MPTIHLLIKGRVQGVSYRVNARAAAERLHITGWVKNTAEGHVEALAIGEDADLKKFVAWCRRGPEHAAVTEVIELPPPGEVYDLKGFAIVR